MVSSTSVERQTLFSQAVAFLYAGLKLLALIEFGIAYPHAPPAPTREKNTDWLRRYYLETMI
jgi:hypothetical protein